MSEHITAFPLTWPDGWKRSKKQEHAPFGRRGANNYLRDVTLSEAATFVLGELKRMGIPKAEVIISTNVKLRLDGLPYSDQKEPADGGASVWWKDGDSRKVIAIHRYYRVADNLYAIGKTIEALRGIDRWGSGEILERTFTGFTALPNLQEETWNQVIDVAAHMPTADVKEIFRKRRFKAHPDQGGSDSEFHRVNQAYEKFMSERGLS